MNPIPLKIAYIGGGSRAWARKLMIDLALAPELTGLVALYDIDLESAQLNEQLGTWLQTQPGVVSRWRYQVSPTLADALRGADFVVISIQPGTLQMMADEIAIAEKYGMFFPVGDTTGAPGLVRGLRAAIVYADFARAIAEHCPRAWVINYTNPLSICTRMLTRVAPELKVFGCCHEVFAVQEMLATLVEKYVSPGDLPARAEIRVNVLGINHFTMISRATGRGLDLLALVRRHMAESGVMREYTRAEVEAFGSWFKSANQVKFTILQRYGVLGAAGDRHLVEFMPGFIHSPAELFRWGVIRTPVAGYRFERWQNAPQETRDLIAGKTPLVLDASGEEGVAQIKALLGLGDLITNTNVENVGQIANLPLRAVVETNARFSYDAITPLVAGELPPGLHALTVQHIANQEMIGQAALTRDRDLAFQAVFNEPTQDLDLNRAWRMFNELLAVSREFLPGWKIE